MVQYAVFAISKITGLLYVCQTSHELETGLCHMTDVIATATEATPVTVTEPTPMNVTEATPVTVTEATQNKTYWQIYATP
jgi:hypothetical protein